MSHPRNCVDKNWRRRLKNEKLPIISDSIVWCILRRRKAKILGENVLEKSDIFSILTSNGTRSEHDRDDETRTVNSVPTLSK